MSFLCVSAHITETVKLGDYALALLLFATNTRNKPASLGNDALALPLFAADIRNTTLVPFELLTLQMLRRQDVCSRQSDR